MFSSPTQMMGKRESNQYDDPNAWHNRFYREVTSKVDEDIIQAPFLRWEGQRQRRTSKRTNPYHLRYACSKGGLRLQ